jgi:restriction system protein
VDQPPASIGNRSNCAIMRPTIIARWHVKLKMAEKSLFAILLRSPWWISIALAAAIALIARLTLPAHLVLYVALGATPFLVTGAIAAWKQFRAPSAANISSTLEAIGIMSWRDFSIAVEDAYRRDGYAVTRLPGPEADFEIVKAGRAALVSCKRWKATSNGIEPLRSLHAAMEARDARESFFITTGGLSDSARRFAIEKNIPVIQGAELARLLRGMPRTRPGPA